MNSNDVELINQWLLYNKYKELNERAENDWYNGKVMIYKNRMDICFYNYMRLLMETKRENIEIAFLETIHENLSELEISIILWSSRFQDFLNEYTLKILESDWIHK